MKRSKVAGRSKMRRSCIVGAVLAAVVYGAVATAGEHAGHICGVVIDAETQKPVAGAYVGVGEFGDSGGSNRSRHRDLGWFAKATTDAAGRFELDGLAFTPAPDRVAEHPLVVTHADYVRHDEDVALPQGGGVPEVVVRLRRGAAIDVTVVDAAGQAVEGFWVFRLEALDGRRFLPPDRDPHMGSFASSIWLQRPRRASHGFTFTTLEGGRYAVDVMQMKMLDNPGPPNPWRPEIVYHGGSQVEVGAGGKAEIRVAPEANDTLITVPLTGLYDEVPARVLEQWGLLVLISRNLGLRMWDSDLTFGPEDERLGRLTKQAMFYMPVQGDAYEFRNFPPGEYTVFGGPAFFMNAAKAVIAKGQTVRVAIPPVIIAKLKQPSVAMWTLSREIELQGGREKVQDLCQRLGGVTEMNPRFVADEAIAQAEITLPKGRMSIWDLLEKLYLERGWRVEEAGEKTLALKAKPLLH